MRNANGETLALVMVVAQYRVRERCRAEGCSGTYAKAQGGLGYCPTHYRQLVRTGHVEPREVWAPRALRDAVFAWADEPTAETVGRVFRAACDLLPTGNGPIFDRDIDPDLAALLLHAADAYAWHPTEPEYDASFADVSAQLDEAALGFARSLARYDRRAVKLSAAKPSAAKLSRRAA